MFKQIKGFIKLRKALGALHAALPDATTEELQAFDDECAICPEPMAKAKRLHCKHLFHLACLRSWYDSCIFLILHLLVLNPMEGGPWRFVSELYVIVVSLACLEIRTLLPLTEKAYKLALEST